MSKFVFDNNVISGGDMLPGGIKRYSVALIKHGDESKIVGITGYTLGYGMYSYSTTHAQGACHPCQVEEILDETYYLHSPIFGVALFYEMWKEEAWFICPECKREYVLPIQTDDLRCGYCTGEYEKRFEEFNHYFRHIELTDEDVRKYNGRVAFKKFKQIFENNTQRIQEDFSCIGYLSDEMPEFLMEHASHINAYKQYMEEEQIHALRRIFAVCYDKARRALYKRDKKNLYEKACQNS